MGSTSAFYSLNNIALQGDGHKFEALDNRVGGDESNDLSWLKEGQDEIRLREEKIKAATLRLQRAFRLFKEKRPETDNAPLYAASSLTPRS